MDTINNEIGILENKKHEKWILLIK
jgi:hypothetical protein